MVQQPPIQLSQLATHFYWNENFDFALMDILEDNWDSPLEYVVSLFNNSCDIYFLKIKNCIQCLQFFLKKNINVCINEILSTA